MHFYRSTLLMLSVCTLVVFYSPKFASAQASPSPSPSSSPSPAPSSSPSPAPEFYETCIVNNLCSNNLITWCYAIQHIGFNAVDNVCEAYCYYKLDHCEEEEDEDKPKRRTVFEIIAKNSCLKICRSRLTNGVGQDPCANLATLLSSECRY